MFLDAFPIQQQVVAAPPRGAVQLGPLIQRHAVRIRHIRNEVAKIVAQDPLQLGADRGSLPFQIGQPGKILAFVEFDGRQARVEKVRGLLLEITLAADGQVDEGADAPGFGADPRFPRGSDFAADEGSQFVDVPFADFTGMAQRLRRGGVKRVFRRRQGHRRAVDPGGLFGLSLPLQQGPFHQQGDEGTGIGAQSALHRRHGAGDI